MVFQCNSCKYIFNKKKSGCPFCGERLHMSSDTVDSLLNTGFTWAPGQSSSMNNYYVQSQEENISSNKHLEKLRQDFSEEHLRSSTASIPDSVDTTGSAHNKNSFNELQNQQGYDFFNKLEHSVINNYDIPTVQPPESPINSNPIDNSFDQELKEIERLRNQEQRRYWFNNIINSITSVHWITLTRIAIFVSIIILATYIWNIRHIILDFVIELFTIILTLWFILTILISSLRSLFK